MINLRGKIPEFILISTGKVHDVNAMDDIPDCWYVMDRGYLDFERLYAIHEARAFFATRSKTNTQYERVYSNPVDKSTGVLCDQRVRLTGQKALKNYPELIRRIKDIDSETGKRLTFLTNNFLVDAKTISVVYKNRWHVELFFKWIKQHLHVKSFYGFSPNAVKSQLWIAVCVDTLLVIMQKRNGFMQTPYEILQILSVSIFEKTSLFSVFSDKSDTFENDCDCNQLTLFDL
jgi:IS4 transposase